LIGLHLYLPTRALAVSCKQAVASMQGSR
jgi:hypothetical protein